MTRRVMTQIETVKMSQLMAQHIRILPDKGTPDQPICEYVNGYDDEKIAQEINPELHSNHARTLRVNIFGVLYDKPTAAAQEQSKRIDFLEQKLGDVLLLLSELTSKHDKLCLGISLAKIGFDSRHLVVDNKNVTPMIAAPQGATAEFKNLKQR